jgi:O-antigen ligase
MIGKQPVTGYGIGSFYLMSPMFAPSNDPVASNSIARDYILYLRQEPNFAHNFILQFAAELGIPATLLFCSLIGAAWYNSFRHTRAALKEKNGDRVPLALFLALTTYLITQMTANSLNIYVSHQFLFWFLIAALLGMTREGKQRNES